MAVLRSNPPSACLTGAVRWRGFATRVLLLAVSVLAPAALLPSSALAHGVAERSDLPIPTWLFAWAAALVLIVSFVGLASLWPRPKLEQEHWRSLGGVGRLLGARAVDIVCGAIGCPCSC